MKMGIHRKNNKVSGIFLMKDFEKLKNKTLYNYVDKSNKDFMEKINNDYNFSFQEFKFLCDYAIDLRMWQEKSFKEYWINLEQEVLLKDKRERKKKIFNLFRDKIEELKKEEKFYSNIIENAVKPSQKRTVKIIEQDLNKNIFGLCPVASSKTMCCKLYTLDVVEGCSFSCSYCVIDTFYDKDILFNKNIHNKLKQIKLDKNKFYHIGTGQSSDALAWGNREGILDELCLFAKENSNILLELKTKSDNVTYFLEKDIPDNVVRSWTLNTDTIINNEEHFTASLKQRIEAAKKIRDCNIKVGFHFHPMVYYKNWEQEYTNIAEELQKVFLPEQISFISFGSVTFIKPAIKNIRKRGYTSKILQMQMIPDPHGRLTYSDDIKTIQFKAMYQAFKAWHDKVYFYLCMEKSSIWDSVFGRHYNNNEEFEQDYGKKTLGFE